MFGRDKLQNDGDDWVAVDATLELDLNSVEVSIDAYLNDQSDSARQQLVAELANLDQQIDQGDAYENSIIGSAAIGYSTKGSVIGETSNASAAEEISGAELQAQTGLIRAAKQEVTSPTPETLTELRAAKQALAAVRRRVAGAQ